MLSHTNLRAKKTCFKMPHIQQIHTKKLKIKIKIHTQKKTLINCNIFKFASHSFQKRTVNCHRPIIN